MFKSIFKKKYEFKTNIKTNIKNNLTKVYNQQINIYKEKKDKNENIGNTNENKEKKNKENKENKENKGNKEKITKTTNTINYTNDTNYLRIIENSILFDFFLNVLIFYLPAKLTQTILEICYELSSETKLFIYGAVAVFINETRPSFNNTFDKINWLLNLIIINYIIDSIKIKLFKNAKSRKHKSKNTNTNN